MFDSYPRLKKIQPRQTQKKISDKIVPTSSADTKSALETGKEASESWSEIHH